MLLALKWIVLSFIYIYRKLPTRIFWLIISTLITSIYITYYHYEKEFDLSFVPDALGIHSVSYHKEESWGIGGPGDNESGILVYPLSNEISKQISEQGINFFRNIPPNTNQRDRDFRGYYTNWSETPVKSTTFWAYRENSSKLYISDYVCRYGFCIDIDPIIETNANLIVNSTGNYYAYGRTGLIIVSPKKNIVLYLYSD